MACISIEKYDVIEFTSTLLHLIRMQYDEDGPEMPFVK